MRGKGLEMTGIQKVFTTAAGSAFTVVLLFLTPTIARATTTNLSNGASISLATIIDNNLNVQIADKNFGNFFFSYNDTDNISSDDLTRSNVTITALSNSFGFGVSFTQPLLALGPVIKDIVLRYSVAVTDPNFLISDIHLDINGSAGNGGLGSVGETVTTNGFGGTTVATLQASIPVASGDVASSNIVPPVVQLWAEKDVIVTGGNNANGFASISEIDQSYSQVPEPSTMMLVGLGLMGVVAVNRKRKS